jgi:hypothetical protein
MDQAESNVITIPRPAARPPLRPTVRAAFLPIQSAHLALVTAVASTAPHAFIGNADAADVRERAEHLEKIFPAVRAYVNAVVNDTIDRMQFGVVFNRDIDDILADTFSDVVSALKRGAVTMEMTENWSAE